VQEHKEAFQATFETVRERNAAAEPFLDKAVDDLNPARVLRLFHKVLDEDLPLLDLGCRPETLLVTYLAVPPVRATLMRVPAVSACGVYLWSNFICE
jgi:DNA-directed RNA polymerase III subunit RPC1